MEYIGYRRALRDLSSEYPRVSSFDLDTQPRCSNYTKSKTTVNLFFEILTHLPGVFPGTSTTPSLRTRDPSTAVSFSLFRGLSVGKEKTLNCSSDDINTECPPVISAFCVRPASCNNNASRGFYKYCDHWSNIVPTLGFEPITFNLLIIAKVD